MNDKYIAERLGIMESKIDWIASQFTTKIGNPFDTCPFCGEKIKFIIATDGAPVRKCGCSTGIVPVDVSSYSPSTPAK